MNLASGLNIAAASLDSDWALESKGASAAYSTYNHAHAYEDAQKYSKNAYLSVEVSSLSWSHSHIEQDALSRTVYNHV